MPSQGNGAESEDDAAGGDDVEGRKMKRVVKAGRVVANVAVRCVERKSVREMKGSRRRLHLVVKMRRVSTISSRVL